MGGCACEACNCPGRSLGWLQEPLPRLPQGCVWPAGWTAARAPSMASGITEPAQGTHRLPAPAQPLPQLPQPKPRPLNSIETGLVAIAKPHALPPLFPDVP